MADPITDYYASEPWSAITDKERDWYVPLLMDAFFQRSTYADMVPVKVDLTAQETRTMIFSGMWRLEPNWNALGDRQIWLDTMHPASWQQRITTHHYGGKMAVHELDPLITYWKASGGGAGGLVPMVNNLLAGAIIDQLEIQVRNAFAESQMTFFSDGAGGSSGTGFSDIAATDVYVPSILRDLNLAFDYNQVHQQGTSLRAVAYCSPGQVYEAEDNADFKGVLEVARARQLLNYEVGEYKGVGHVSNVINTLWNMGTITAQAPIAAAVNAGDGAPIADPDAGTGYVDGVKEVGQKAGTQTPYIELGVFTTGLISDLVVGDVITLHTLRSAGTVLPYDVANAPIPSDGTITNRRIVEIDDVNGYIYLDRPVQKELVTDLGAGVYGYLTKGLHIHMAVVNAAPGAVVGGFTMPPVIRFPMVIDDTGSMYRVSWHGWYEYKLFRPEVVAVIYTSGPVAPMGFKATGA